MAEIDFSEQLQQAWQFVEFTGMSIFLTGKAGTGKTTFLRYVVANSSKRIAVTAPTGVAAINAGGVTIHSLLQIAPGPFVPGSKQKEKFDFRKEKLRLLRSLDMLVIDEISMVRGDLLDAIDDTLRRVRRNQEPFGGVQLLMIGDLAQLTPVVTSDEEALLKQWYDTPYFFGSRALRNVEYVTIQLDKVYRQSDPRFLEILNHIRTGMPTDEDMRLLNSRCDRTFDPQKNQGYIRLGTHNAQVNNYNAKRLSELPGQTYSYSAMVDGTFPDLMFPTDKKLTLKEGAQVMFVKNDPSQLKEYYNGKIGRIISISENSIEVYCEGDPGSIDVKPLTWENIKYEINDKTQEMESVVQGTFKQLPLRLAWAITVHKSQGLTFDHAVVDVNRSFAPGQVYVALSRCRSLEGMVLTTPLSRSAIISDGRVSNYIESQDIRATESVRRLPELKQSYGRAMLLELFNFLPLDDFVNRQMKVLAELPKGYRDLKQLHQQRIETFNKEVKEVSLKWNLVINKKTDEQLHEKEFLDRVVSACSYFREKLKELLGDLIIMATGVKDSSNKVLMKRFKAIREDFADAYTRKMYVLAEINRIGFTMENYLKAKQHSWTAELNQPKSTKKRKKK